MIITPKTPGATSMRIVDKDGTDLTQKFAVMYFDTETGEMRYHEKLKTKNMRGFILGELETKFYPRAEVYTFK